jgi:hypothetical protein
MAALHPANNTTMTATKTPSHRLFCIATLIGGLSLITLSGPARAQDSAQTEQAPRWSARQLALAEAFAGALQESLVAGNQGAFLRAWDPAVIARAVCKDVQADEQSLANLRASLERAAGEARASWFADWRQNDVRYKRLVMGDEKLFARFRLIRDGGISFLDIEMESNGGKWRAVGFRNLALGSNLIDTLRQMALPTIEKVDASYATRVFVGAETAEINAESLRHEFCVRPSRRPGAILAGERHLKDKAAGAIAALMDLVLQVRPWEEVVVSALQRLRRVHGSTSVASNNNP